MQYIHNQVKPLLLNKASHFNWQRASKQYFEACQTRTTITMERMSGLAIMNIHNETPLDYDAVVKIFAKIYPRRIVLVDPTFDEDTKLKKEKMQYIFITVL